MNLTPENERKIFSFDQDVHKTGGGLFIFIANLSYMFRDIFPGMDNYDVEDRLWQRGIISEHEARESESCELVVYFSDKAYALGFVARLNEYIAKKYELLEKALNF